MTKWKQVCVDDLAKIPPQQFEKLITNYHKHLISAFAANMTLVIRFREQNFSHRARWIWSFSIPPSTFTDLCLGRGGGSLSREAQTSLSPATSSSYSRKMPRCSHTSHKTVSPAWPLGPPPRRTCTNPSPGMRLGGIQTPSWIKSECINWILYFLGWMVLWSTV